MINETILIFKVVNFPFLHGEVRHSPSFKGVYISQFIQFATVCSRVSDFNNRIGAQWLSGRVLDSRPKGRGFEPHRRHCVVVLEQDTFILA